MRLGLGAVGAMLVSATAMAQSASVPTGSFAVPVETLTLGKAKAKLFATAFSAGPYVFSAETTVRNLGRAFTLTIVGSTKGRKQISVDYRFARSDGTQVARGQCTVQVKTMSGLWNSAENSLYRCDFEGLPPTDYAMEAVLPNLPADGGGLISLSRENSDRYKPIRARLRYKGVIYDAVPTGFDLSREAKHYRVVNGYTITREGRTIGQLDFPVIKNMMMDFNGSLDRKSLFTVPTNEADGREAVIFFCAQLMQLPEANSPLLKQ